MYYVIGASVPSLHRESTAFSNNFLKEIYYLHGFIKFVKDFVVKRFSHAVYNVHVHVVYIHVHVHVYIHVHVQLLLANYE